MIKMEIAKVEQATAEIVNQLLSKQNSIINDIKSNQISLVEKVKQNPKKWNSSSMKINLRLVFTSWTDSSIDFV